MLIDIDQISGFDVFVLLLPQVQLLCCIWGIHPNMPGGTPHGEWWSDPTTCYFSFTACQWISKCHWGVWVRRYVEWWVVLHIIFIYLISCHFVPLFFLLAL